MGIVAGSYTIVGGLSSVINADAIQSVILLVGSIILSILCFNSIGGWENFVDRFHDGVWLKLIRPIDDPTVPWPGLLFGVTILSFYFWGNNQVMVQRVLSAKSIDEGRKGVLFVGFLYMFTLFIFIMPGLIARGIDLFGVGDALPDEIISGGVLKETYGINTDEVYPRLIVKLLPVGLIGVIIAAMISALTSTLSATLSSVSTLFTMDFYSRYVKVNDSKKMVRIGQIASFVALVIAISWAPFIQKFDSLVGYYQEMVSYIAPPIVGAFFIGVFWKRANAICRSLWRQPKYNEGIRRSLCPEQTPFLGQPGCGCLSVLDEELREKPWPKPFNRLNNIILHLFSRLNTLESAGARPDVSASGSM